MVVVFTCFVAVKHVIKLTVKWYLKNEFTRKMVVKHNTTCFRARKKDITFKYLKHLKNIRLCFFSHKEIPLYRNKLSRDDIECGKVRYHRSRIFARIFLQKSAHHLANRWLRDALWTVQDYGLGSRPVPNRTFQWVGISVRNGPGTESIVLGV